MTIGLLSGGVRAEDEKVAGDVTGTWKSTFTAPNGQTIETIYKLNQEAETPTGTVIGRDGKEVKIDQGKVKAGKLSFQVAGEVGERKFKMKYQGKLSGDAIKGKVQIGQGDQARSFDWEAKREKK